MSSLEEQGGGKMEIGEVIKQLKTLEGEIREKLIKARDLAFKLGKKISLDETNQLINVSSNPGLKALVKICERY